MAFSFLPPSFCVPLISPYLLFIFLLLFLPCNSLPQRVNLNILLDLCFFSMTFMASKAFITAPHLLLPLACIQSLLCMQTLSKLHHTYCIDKGVKPSTCNTSNSDTKEPTFLLALNSPLIFFCTPSLTLHPWPPLLNPCLCLLSPLALSTFSQHVLRFHLDSCQNEDIRV